MLYPGYPCFICFRQLCCVSRATSSPGAWSHLDVPDISVDGRRLGSAPNLKSLGGLAVVVTVFFPQKLLLRNSALSWFAEFFPPQSFFATAFARLRTKGSADLSGGNSPHVTLGGQEDSQRHPTTGESQRPLYRTQHTF